MSTGKFFIIAVAILTGAAGGYLAAVKFQTEHIPYAVMQPPPAAPAKDERKVLYWYDPMHPQQQFDKPGKSPFMDMQLVPRFADVGNHAATVSIDPAIAQNLGMRLATVTRGTLAPEIVTVGTLTWNDRDVAVIQPRAGGFVERVYARAPQDLIKADAPIADILVPEWVAAQTEFLALVRVGETALADAARSRLRLLGMTPAQIARMEKTGAPQTIYTVSSPIGGVIQTLEVRAGMTVISGQTLATVHGLDTVWLDVAVPETQGGLVYAGNTAEARFTAFPGEVFTGKVIALLPETNTESRTLRLRIEFDNSAERFRPGMYAEVKLRADEQPEILQLPSEAIIRTGTRALVMRVEGDGRYRPVEVETGREYEGNTVILRGLREGEQVVASGQFLIDSEASLRGIEVQSLEDN